MAEWRSGGFVNFAAALRRSRARSQAPIPAGSRLEFGVLLFVVAFVAGFVFIAMTR